MPVLVLGDDAASCIAVHEYRKVVRRDRVILVRFSKELGYLRCLLPYYAVGLVNDYRAISPAVLEVVDMVEVVPLADVADEVGALKEVGAPGWKILLAAWPSMDAKGVVNLLRPEDAEELRMVLDERREVVVYGGVAALPVVDALVRAGYRVSLVWDGKEFDEEMLWKLRDDLQRAGVRLLAELPEPSGDRVIVNYGGGTAMTPLDLPLTGGRVYVDAATRVVGRDVYALGMATSVVEPEGFVHEVRCEEEALLQARNFAAHGTGTPHPPLRRYFAGRFLGRVYASFGLTMREAEALKVEASATRIKGWGALGDAVLKVVASRDGSLLGVQVIVSEEWSWALGLLYVMVLARMDLATASRALKPIDPWSSVVDCPFSKAFSALLRKTAPSWKPSPSPDLAEASR